MPGPRRGGGRGSRRDERTDRRGDGDRARSRGAPDPEEVRRPRPAPADVSPPERLPVRPALARRDVSRDRLSDLLHLLPFVLRYAAKPGDGGQDLRRYGELWPY